jgi:hypothetical protein
MPGGRQKDPLDQYVYIKFDSYVDGNGKLIENCKDTTKQM